MKERKERLIKVRADNKTIKIIFNKRKWQNLVATIIENILIFATMFAIGMIPICPVAMMRNWSITGTPLIILVCCLAWLGIIAIYSYIVNKPTKKNNK